MAITITDVASVDWSRSDLWEVYFPYHPIPGFKSWVPATDVSRTAWDVKSKEFDFGLLGFSIPEGSTAGKIRLTLNDNVNGDVINYFKKWINQDMLNKAEGLNYLGNYTRYMEYHHLDKMKNIIFSQSYRDYVIPTGQFDHASTSEGTVLTVAVELFIVSVFIG